MPRRTKPATGRRPYRRDRRPQIDQIEARRKELGLSVAQLAARASIDAATYFRMRRAGLAFERHVKALQMALRLFDREARNLTGLFARDGQ